MEISLKYGLHPSLQITAGTGSVNSVFAVNEHEYIATTTRDIIKFEGNSIKASEAIPFECAVFIPKGDFVVGVTHTKHEFIVLQANNFKKPLLQGINTNQVTIFHMIYSPVSSSIITIGTGIKVWKISLPNPDAPLSHSKQDIKITPLSSFLPAFDSQILNSPSFDFSDEFLILPSSQGLQRYNLKGDVTGTLSKSPASKSTVYAYFQPSQKLIVTENFDLCAWNKFQAMTHRFPLSNESIISCFVADKENAIVITSQLNFYMLNMKTGKFWRCFSSQQPINRVFYSNNAIAIVSGSQITINKITIPWKTWAQGVNKAKIIMRETKLNSAARIIILGSRNFLRFFSPKTRTQLTACSLPISIPVISVFYDRNDKKDQLLAVLDDGVICGFDTMVSPCKEILHVDIKATSVVSYNTDTKPGYAVTTTSGILHLCDYNTFEIKSSIQLVKFTPTAIRLFWNGSLLLVVTNEEIVLFDPNTQTIINRYSTKSEDVVAFFNNVIYLGGSNGSISKFEIKDNTINEIHSNSQRAHNSAITSINFGEMFWISTSIDGELKYWDYSSVCIAQIQFNIPIYSCSVINGFRDVLVAIESEIMMIPGKVIFGETKDPENKELDNFDKKADFLAADVIKQQAIDAEKREIEEELKKQKEAEMIKPKKKPNRKIKSFNNILNSRQQNMEAPALVQETHTSHEDERQKMLDEMIGYSDLSDSKPSSSTSRPPQIQSEEISDKGKYSHTKENDELEQDSSKPGIINTQAIPLFSFSQPKTNLAEIIDIKIEKDVQHEIKETKKEEIVQPEILEKKKPKPPSMPKHKSDHKKPVHSNGSAPETILSQRDPEKSSMSAHSQQQTQQQPKIKEKKPKAPDMPKQSNAKPKPPCYLQPPTKIKEGQLPQNLLDDKPVQIKSPAIPDKQEENIVPNSLFPCVFLDSNTEPQYKSSKSLQSPEKLPMNDAIPMASTLITSNKSTKYPSSGSSPRMIKRNRYSFDPDNPVCMRRKLSLSQSDSTIFDPKSQPALYRISFFKKDKGYSMSTRTLKTILLPPIAFEDEDDIFDTSSFSKANSNAENIFVRPKRLQTPPIVRKFLTSPIIESSKKAKQYRSLTPTRKSTFYILKKTVIDEDEMKLLYGRGNHDLQPLAFIDIEDSGYDYPSHVLRQSHPKMKIRNDFASPKGKLTESLVIQPIHVVPQEPPTLSAGISRAKIVVPTSPRKGKK